MFRYWRLSTVNGLLLAAYFVPAWTIAAFKIMVSPVHGLFDRSNVSIAFFMTETLGLQSGNIVRLAWLLALGKLTVVTFFAVFAVMVTRKSLRASRGCDEPMIMALIFASVISFAGMMMARVTEAAVLRLHASELLLLAGAAIVLALEAPVQQPEATRTLSTKPANV